MKLEKTTFSINKKGLFTLLVASLFLITVFPVMAPGDEPGYSDNDISIIGDSGSSTITRTIHFGVPTLADIVLFNQTFTQVKIPGVITTGNTPGKPSYLAYPLKIALPVGSELGTLTVNKELIELESTRNLGDKPVYPHQLPQPIGKEADSLVMDLDAYASIQMTPGITHESLGVDYCHGYPILTLNLYPVQYIPGENKLYYSPDITLKVTLDNTGYIDRFYRNRFDDHDYVSSLVVNPEDVTIPVPTLDEPFSYPGGLCDPSDDYDYVIITRASLVDFTAAYNWTDLIAQKQSEGLTATVVSYEDITTCSDYDNVTPYNDNQAHVREFCRDAYQDWGIQYVLIAGDHSGVAAIPRRLMDTNYEGNIESDIYWSNLNNNFNADGDGDWGEEGDTGFDLYSELFIGSIPCDTGTDISNWITKNLYYANNYEEDYMENMAFYGGDTGWSCQGDDFIDFTFYGTADWMGPDPHNDGPWPSFLGFLEGFDTWNTTHPGAEWNNSVRWTAEPPNPGWQGGSESAAIAGLRNAINNDDVTQIYGIAHANSGMSLDVYDSTWESSYHNTRPFLIHDYGCHCGDMSASDDGVLHSMLFHSDTELAFACVYNTCYGWGNNGGTNSSSALQQKFFVDYMFNETKCGGTQNWQLGRIQAATKDQMAPTILWDYSYGTWRAIIQGCLLFGDPAQTLKPPLLPEHNIVLQSMNVPAHVLPDQSVSVDVTLFNNGQNNETNVRVSFQVNDTELDFATIPFFEKLTFEQLSFTWTPSLGYYYVTVNVTIPGINENITSDNEKTQLVIAGGDVAVTNINLPYYAGIGSLTTIQADIVNYGAEDTYVDVFLNVSNVIVDSINILIEAGKTQTVDFLWNPLLEGLNAIHVKASTPNEVYLFNNIKSGLCTVVSAKGFVLLVDDDEGDDYETYYQNALMASGYLYDYWNRDSNGCPTAAAMSQYSAVVWFTGDDGSTTLVTEDQNTLGTYLDNGGRLFVTGQDIGYDIRTSPFYSNYLHATYGVDDTNVVDLDGTAGDPIGDGLTLVITSGDGANNQGWPSGITVVNPATEVLTYHNNPYDAGLKVDTGTYRVVYFAFGFEGINNMNDRNTVMNRTITWLATGGSYALSDVTLDPATLDYITSPGSVVADTLTLGNHVDATGNLTYQFTNIPSGVSIAPSSGTIIPGGITSLTLTIDTSYLTGNFSHFFFTLETNDPDESLLNIPVYVSMGGIPLDLTLSAGWNLITIPFDTYWTAESLGTPGIIPTCTVVAKFDASTQTFASHIIGTPHDDFHLEPGVGYFIYLTSDTTTTLGGRAIGTVSVHIYTTWNMIGWYQDYDTTADTLYNAIPGTTVVSMFNAATQTFFSYVGVKWDEFPITRGMGIFIYATQESDWDGYD